MMRLNLISLFAMVWFLVAAFPLAGHTAPQILALVATDAPLPLHCSAGMCKVEVSGVCLQEHRKAPEAGTAYRVTNEAGLTLVVQDGKGRTRAMAVDKLVQIRSLRLFNSLSISLPHELIENLGEDIVSASLSVAPMTTLLPEAEAGDPNPLSEKEIRETTGRLRALAEDAIGHDQVNLQATRILNHMINRLPADTPVGAEGLANLRDHKMIAKAAAEMPKAAKLINRALDGCREKLRVERTPHLRACLSNEHDILNSNTTQNVWRSLRPSG